MNRSKVKLLWTIGGGILLITAGVIILLNNLGVISLAWEVLLGPLFALGGLVFLLVFIFNTDEWWALIPGFVLLGIGTIIFMGQTVSTAAERWSGSIFLAFVGLPFWLIYISHADHWWAIIPGGVLITLAGVNAIPEGTQLSGVIFFLGLALTFGLVYVLPKPSGKLKWALYPAVVLLLIGLLVLLGATNLMQFVWPAALLIGGGYLVFRAMRKQ